MQGNADQIVTHSRIAALSCGIAAAAAVLVYLNALNNPFVYDDHHTVVANPSIDRLSDLKAIVLHDVTRPVVNLSYAVDRRWWGQPPFGFHLTNVVLHAIDVVLLFALARALYQSAGLTRTADGGLERFSAADATVMACSAALLFAVHPMMTEAVGYVSGRSEVLCGVFFLLAIMAGRRWLRGDGGLWAAATGLLWVAALATKETAAMFPLVLVAYDELVTAPDADERRRRWRRVHGPLIGVAVLAAAIRVVVLVRLEARGGAAIHWPYVLVALDVVRRYVMLLVNPRGQTIFHEVAAIDSLLAPAAALAIGSAVVLAWFAWNARRIAGVASFGVVWFLLLLVPGAALTILNQGEPMAEHRVYLASCGLFLAAGDGVGRLRAWASRAGAAARWLAPALVTIVVVALGVQTLARNRVWRSPVALWRESVELAPKHYRPRLLLGEALQDDGRRSEAIDEFKTAIQLRPKDPTAYNKLGALLAALGRTDEARQNFRRVLEIDAQNEIARRALTVMDRAEPRHGIDSARR